MLENPDSAIDCEYSLGCLKIVVKFYAKRFTKRLVGLRMHLQKRVFFSSKFSD